MNVTPYRICPGCRAQWAAHDPAYDRCPTCGAAVPRLALGTFGQASGDPWQARRKLRMVGLFVGLGLGALCIVVGVVIAVVVRPGTPVTPAKTRTHR
jgi:hypothetical protein